ncbi:DUF4926 domain-containing protein [Synechococcales cyanobacterium C]|uniref:DUF4926 domain-containing protein n=1 Tax=Petrachloros mirabilis ULC683 TaxID=2781853 RepID=A0A8K2A844_9CYAN|nr:DUF4926 domain-containing protein [Petrachloros mirabilis]NCJ06605.1 DUF4926 domain-containing protein [Petrachloros mirabilis ULC683]
MTALQRLDTVTNLQPIARDRLTLVEPEYQLIQSLPAGQVGTVLEVYPGEQPSYLVEFADLEGREYAMANLKPDEMLTLHYELLHAS